MADRGAREGTRVRRMWRLAGASAGACAVLALASAACAAPTREPRSPLEGWRFRMRDFVIGAWLGPDGTDGELRVYKEAGFNVVMVGRYMAHGEYALPERVARELDLAHRHGLWAMIDTYTQNERPWGGVVPTGGKGHHPSSLAELQWIHRQFGRHPALAGYMIGDDQGTMSPQLVECTRFLREHAPDLMPWICGWVPARELAAHSNPFANWQIYPTLYNTGDTAEQQAHSYCQAYDHLRQDCLRYGVLPWPMFNAGGKDVSDSLLRFPIYAALAYGAQGLWYFTYRGALNNGIEGQPGFETYEAARTDVRPNWFVARDANRRVAAYGPRILGARCTGVFSTGWPIRGSAAPHAEKLVAGLSDNVLVGDLTKPGRPPMAMVVDKRVSKAPSAHPARAVEVTFNALVTGVRILNTRGERWVRGRKVTLSLAGGEGMLLVLEARPWSRRALEHLATVEAIAATWEPRIRARTPWFVREMTVTIEPRAPGLELRYTLDGSEPSAASPRYEGPITLRQTTTVKAVHHAPGTRYEGYVASALFTLTEGLKEVAAYRLGEEGTTLQSDAAPPTASDRSGNGMDLTRRGSPTLSRQGAPACGGATSVRFHPASGDVYVRDGIVTSATDWFGVEAWVRPEQATESGLIVYNGDSSRSGFGLFQEGGRWAGLFGGVTVITGSEVRVGEWTHLALVRDRGQTRLYVNGMQVASPIASAPNPATGSFVIGGSPDGKSQCFAGLVDEVRVFAFSPG